MKVSEDLISDVSEVLLTEEQIAAKVAELGKRISDDYAGRQLTLVSVLKGSLPFMADLMRRITLPLRIDLMEVSSYGGTSTESSGLVRILKDLSAPYRRARRAAGRGHHRHRADPQLPAPLLAGQEARIRSRSVLCSTSRPGVWSRFRSTTWDLRFRTPSSWGMVSTSARSTETSASSACSAPRPTSPEEAPTCITLRRAVDAGSLRSARSSLWGRASCSGGRPAAIRACRDRPRPALFDHRRRLSDDVLAGVATLLLITLPFASEKPLR